MLLKYRAKIRVACSVYGFLFSCLFLVLAIEKHAFLFVINITAWLTKRKDNP